VDPDGLITTTWSAIAGGARSGAGGGPVGVVIGTELGLVIGILKGDIVLDIDTPETLITPYKRKKKDPKIMAKEKAKLKRDNPCEPPQQEDPEKDPPPSIEPTKEQQLRREPLWAKIWRAIRSQYDPTIHY